MALNTTLSGGLSPQMKTFYDRRLLVRALPNLIYTQFAQQRPLPKRGGKTIEFRSFAPLAIDDTPLVEGEPPTLKDLSSTAIEATVAQFGDAVGLSDLVDTVSIDPLLTETTDLLGEQSGELIDQVVRDILVAGTTVLYAGAATDRTTIAVTDVMDIDTLRLAVLQLKLNRAKPINGRWVCLAHTRTMHDIQSTSEWVTANQHAGSQRIFNGSVGTLYGVEFFESDLAPVIAAGTGGSSATADVYQTLFMGRDAFGMVKLAGHNLRTYYKALGSAGTADPIDQQQSMGWKCTFTAKILYQPWIVRVEHAAETSAN